MAERLNAPVSKTGMGFQSIGGSNPPLSAVIQLSAHDSPVPEPGMVTMSRAPHVHVGSTVGELHRVAAEMDDRPDHRRGAPDCRESIGAGMNLLLPRSRGMGRRTSRAARDWARKESTRLSVRDRGVPRPEPRSAVASRSSGPDQEI